MKLSITLLCSAVILALVGVGCVPAPASCSDTFTVTTNLDTNDGACTAAHCSLREAIIAANTCAGQQTIILPAANYQLTILGSEEDSAATGDLDITDDLILHGEGVPSIDGVSEDRIFEIFSTAEVEIDHVILMYGLAQLGGAVRSHGTLTMTACSIHNNVADVPPGGSGASSGGGIFVEAGTTTLIGTDVLENYADYGGGIHNFATASFHMSGGHLGGNIASGWGGGLWNNMASDSTLENVVILRNSAAERGAGIYNNGTVEGTSVTFNENIDALKGAGVYNDDNGEMFLTTAWFTNNAAQLGGAIYNLGLLHLYQSSITNNTALGGLGGGVYNDGAGAALLLRNTTVSGNMIVPFDVPGGSGVYNDSGEVRLEFVTLAYNNADGVGNVGGMINIRSTILAYHALGNCSGVTGGSQGYNLEDGDTCNLIEPTDLVDTDPMLLWLDMYGGTTLSHALSPGSPAIDSGDPDRCIDVDQRGVTRPQGPLCDRGAFEAEPVIATPPAVPMALALTNAYCHKGPDVGWDSTTILEEGLSYEIVGRTPFNDWWRLALPGDIFCWVADSQVEVTGDATGVSAFDPIPYATDTPTPAIGCYVGKICVVPCPPGTLRPITCTP